MHRVCDPAVLCATDMTSLHIRVNVGLWQTAASQSCIRSDPTVIRFVVGWCRWQPRPPLSVQHSGKPYNKA